MKRLQAIFFCLTLAVAAFADIHVKGTVIDADTSEPMIGVSILVKGTSTGTVTDFDGNFDINVPDKATLQLSYMGYKTIEIRAVEDMQIIMETDAQQLQEVVSLGYSAVKKAELSSAVVTVDAEKLTDVTTSDIGNMLQGKVAGLTVSNAGGQPPRRSVSVVQVLSMPVLLLSTWSMVSWAVRSTPMTLRPSPY